MRSKLIRSPSRKETVRAATSIRATSRPSWTPSTRSPRREEAPRCRPASDTRSVRWRPPGRRPRSPHRRRSARRRVSEPAGRSSRTPSPVAQPSRSCARTGSSGARRCRRRNAPHPLLVVPRGEVAPRLPARPHGRGPRDSRRRSRWASRGGAPGTGIACTGRVPGGRCTPRATVR